jgi:hypothetical protein
MTGMSLTWASVMYVRAAKQFSDQASVLDDPERANGKNDSEIGALVAELSHTSLAAVMIASAAVEASINELYLESGLMLPGDRFQGGDPQISRALLDAWNHGVDHYEVITKCHIATAIAGKPRINFGSGRAQQLTNLIKLRNTLVHHKPTWVTTEEGATESDDQIERRISNCFPHSKLGSQYDFRWNKCLGAGCAKWAYNTSTEFIREFFFRLDLQYHSSLF